MFDYQKVLRNESVYVIAELGANHNGDMDLAYRLIDSAKDVGADCIKLQSWSVDSLFSKKAYENNSALKESVEEYSINREQHLQLKKYCDEVGIDFASTPFSMNEVDMLVDELDVPFIKIASMDLNNLPFLKYVATKHKPVVLSTGLGALADVDIAVRCLEESGCKEIILLHCIANYPPEDKEVNLNNIDMLKKTFEYPVGYSDHTLGTVAPILSIAKGACVIEKHYTLDKNMEGWDHKVSANPEELAIIVEAARRGVQMMGTKRKRVVEPVEKRNAFQRSIVAARPIKQGSRITAEDLDYKRPGTGIAPKYNEFIIGKEAKRDIAYDEIINMEDF